MKNLKDKASQQEIVERMSQLRSDSQRKWGLMSPDQMVYHCNRSMAYIMNEYSIPSNTNFLKRLIFKPLALGNMPFPQGKAQAFEEFKASGSYDLETEKKNFDVYLRKYAGLDPAQELPPSPLIGKLSFSEWGRLHYKHFDHHLRQFGL
jgi:hypothetical protein